jgi:hypothetical protein
MVKVLAIILLTGSLVCFASGSALAECSDTDFNGDGATNEADLEILKSLIGANEDLEGFSPVVDLNDDGQIDLADFNLFIGCTS